MLIPLSTGVWNAFVYRWVSRQLFTRWFHRDLPTHESLHKLYILCQFCLPDRYFKKGLKWSAAPSRTMAVLTRARKIMIWDPINRIAGAGVGWGMCCWREIRPQSRTHWETQEQGTGWGRVASSPGRVLWVWGWSPRVHHWKAWSLVW